MNKDRNFYEITNGKCGESYIRRYVWARDTEEISKLMREDPQLEMRGFTIKFLFKGRSESFITAWSDTGFVSLGSEMGEND